MVSQDVSTRGSVEKLHISEYFPLSVRGLVSGQEVLCSKSLHQTDIHNLALILLWALNRGNHYWSGYLSDSFPWHFYVGKPFQKPPIIFSEWFIVLNNSGSFNQYQMIGCSLQSFTFNRYEEFKALKYFKEHRLLYSSHHSVNSKTVLPHCSACPDLPSHCNVRSNDWAIKRSHASHSSCL